VTGSLAAFARLYSLRVDPHAQKEIQELAEQIGSIVKPLFPASWEALTLRES
jgi:thymidylate synthase (FAD)